MKTFQKTLLSLAVCLISLSFQACMPNLARTNARIEKGVDLGVNFLVDRTSKDTIQSDEQSRLQVNMQLGVGGRNESNFGFSILGKAGILSSPSLDFYMELPSSHPFYYGFGFELTDGVGGYAIATYYMNETWFTTLTGRVLRWEFEEQLYNPQIAFGYSAKDGSPTTSIFAGYQYYDGDGLDLDAHIYGSANVGLVNHLVYAGLGIDF